MPPRFPPRPKNGPSQPLYHCRDCGMALRRAEIVRTEGMVYCGSCADDRDHEEDG